MSGIVGIINFDGAPVDRDLLQRMTAFMTFRGPDRQDIWLNGNVGFGHTTLRTTFESETDKQPATLNGYVWLTADARLDARTELLGKLEAKLSRKIRFDDFKKTNNAKRLPNDSELILLAYEAWGEDSVNHLLGDFAFAIWDCRNRQLFCARDHFGVKPFYYAQTGTTFLFSNTLNCLRLHSNIKSDLNKTAVADYLLSGLNQDLSSTIFSDIHRLPAASRLILRENNQRLQRYWTPPTDSEILFLHSDDYVQRFLELFTQAVDDRLRTRNVAISMSGGLDSTSVAAVAKDLLQRSKQPFDLHAYVVVYDRLIRDEERHYSNEAATGLGIPITHLAADEYSIFEERQPNDLQQPEPFFVSPTSAQFNELLSSMAQCGRVALTGYDGDAFMSEPPNAHFSTLAKSLKIGTLSRDMASYIRSHHRLPPVGFRTVLKRMIGAYPRKAIYPEWIDESFSRELNLPGRWQQLAAESVKKHPTRPYAFRVLESTSWAPLFEGFDSGITKIPFEFRHPMIDVRLVEYMLAIPPVPWCLNKQILRLAMAGKLPKAVLNRPKTPLAGNPLLLLVKESSVRCVEQFEPAPKLREFIDLSKRPRIAGEQNADKLSNSLRPFVLNHWLTYSWPIKSIVVTEHEIAR